MTALQRALSILIACESVHVYLDLVGQKSLEDDRCALAMQPRIVILIVRPLPLARNQAAGQPG